MGLTLPGVFAMSARRHMQECGTTRAQIGVKNHVNGALNPSAHFRRPIRAG